MPQAAETAPARSAVPGRRVPVADPAGGTPPRCRLDRLPPQSFFLVSAVFHYLGPSLAVLLFARLDVLGVAWLRIASAAVVFALWRRPWRLVRKARGPGAAGGLTLAGGWTLVALGVVLAVMNSAFYLAVDRLPLATVGAIEFLGTVILAAAGARTLRNAGALALTTAGVITITAIRIAGHLLGFAFAFANCALFMLYIVLGHRIANAGRDGSAGRAGTRQPARAGISPIDRLAAAMLIAAVAATPWGLGGALPAFRHPVLLLAGAGVGVCSSVIPYVTDQLAMARLPRATFSLMLALLPVFATVIGAIVLRQVPTAQDVAGIALVVAGVALHQQAHRGGPSVDHVRLGSAGIPRRARQGYRGTLPGVADRETRRLSFGSVAADYDRYRPGPPGQALDWLLPPHAQAVLDLAAGTGAVTRELIGRVPRVIAVEPDERMRAVLSARCPGAEVLAGRGEAIPLPDASVDAVLISSAWHWLDHEHAVPEIARVLRAGGRLGVMWISRDDRVPWVAEFNRLARESREADRTRDQRDDAPQDPEEFRRRRREVTFPPGVPLSQVEERAFEFSLPRTRDELAGLLGTYSGVITLDPEQRADFARRVRAFLDRQPWDRVDLPMICRCLRSTRLPG